MVDLLSEPALLALCGLIGGVALGLAARMGRFCTLGAIEDLLYGDSDTRIRMWVFAIGVAITGSFLLSSFGLLDMQTSIYRAAEWSVAASILGGLMFGYGMAMAGNCGYGALARLGGGDLRSFVIVLVLGLSAYIALSGPLAPMRIWFLSATQTGFDASGGISGMLANITGVSPSIIGLLVGLAFVGLALKSQQLRTSPNALIWASVVGLAIVSGWAGSAWIAADGFSNTPVVSHTFSAPIGETFLFLMTSSGGGLSFGVGSVTGVIGGAYIGSLFKGHFRWEACDDPRELRRQILGAMLMGFGAVLAMGCSIGQGISAFSVLAFSAPVTFVSIFIGASLGLRQLITGFRAI